MYPRSKRSSAIALALCLACLPTPRAMAEFAGSGSPPPVPTDPPPICDIGKPLPYACPASTRADLYGKVCPATPTKDYVVCQSPLAAAVPGLQCWDYGDSFDCDALPYTVNKSLTYRWTAGPLLTVYQPFGNLNPAVNIGCRRFYGGGWVTLTVTTAQGIRSEATQYFNCT